MTYWSDSRVGVTGGAGFLGSHLIKELGRRGIRLIEESRKSGVREFVAIGTICAYPKSTPVPLTACPVSPVGTVPPC